MFKTPLFEINYRNLKKLDERINTSEKTLIFTGSNTMRLLDFQLEYDYVIEKATKATLQILHTNVLLKTLKMQKKF